MECADFLEFQDTLKKMRDLDDKIVYALNVNIPTPSFRGEIDLSQNCKQLYDELQSNYDKRELSIKKCINVTSDKINELKQKKESGDDLTINKVLSKEQNKLRMLKNELFVEEIVKDRSLKIYQERCREYFKPKNYSV
ncbi:protein MIX23 [Halyomorpha halys]|uniref:protein MIX23 n=1 Tax=Halyomorpha halys TaxID=286706 RepID=UPI0006D501A4|nr:coiled-coil domain-containing protein 58 [Halyomorpha halys]